MGVQLLQWAPMAKGSLNRGMLPSRTYLLWKAERKELGMESRGCS